MGKNKKAPVIDIICILDRSGSMRPLQVEVINSFNKFVKDQLKEKGKAKLTLVLFDDKYEIIHDRIKLKDVPDLTEEVYFARGMTSLMDAVGKTITTSKAKDAMVLIQTDGYENSSHEYNQAAIKKLIKEKEDQGWDFMFLGANINAADTGAGYGLHFSKTTQFVSNKAGIKMSFASMGMSSTNYRSMKAKEFEDANDASSAINTTDKKG